ncbi:MAG: PSD1 and planctomycete cytochrome C domain-containing protein [Actinomycetota bacterium]
MLNRPLLASVITLGLAGGAGLLASASAATGAPATAPASPEAIKFFETSVRPVLVTRCQSCHGAERQSGGLRVDSLAALLKGGGGGPALVPGKPEQSLLLKAIAHQPGVAKMPPSGKLAPRQIAEVTRWIAEGAAWPSVQAQAAADRAKHWAFQPVRKPALPAVKNKAWVKSPVDAFILAALEKQGLQPAPPADRRTLIRRATFDLTGLPPTPREIEAFVQDKAPNAYEKVVERLLASPAYGERWGRHWLDVARYADSNGLDENVAHGNAWRYRDWVVKCFNEDKPYNEFVREQLAGDLLVKRAAAKQSAQSQVGAVQTVALNAAPMVPAKADVASHGPLIATGFLVLGPKVLAEADKEKMVMDIVDEQIDTTGKALMGLTLGCARCHDHKFDPISTEDYYALAGIFKSTRTMEDLKTIAKWWENPIPMPQDLEARAAHQKKVAAVEGEIQALVTRSKEALIAGGKTAAELPKDVETAFKPETRAELKALRERLAAVKKEAPEMPAAMGVTEAEAVEVPVHIRGDHLTLGKVVPRRFPIVLAGAQQPPVAPKESGRLQLANWLVQPSHPLTGRVMVNRVWRWHFGKGIVASTDNFGLLGEKPSHPELLDWLAATFVSTGQPGNGSMDQRANEKTRPVAGGSSIDPLPHSPIDPSGLGWSIKKLHRMMLLSSTYQMSSRFDAKAAAADPENLLHWRANVRRLEAEELRDAILAVSGTLDPAMGGSLLHVKNREFFFDHTSTDRTKYDSKRRAIYLPVVRNNVYDVFQLFDFVDPAVLESNRNSTTVAPQALFWMNSPLVSESAATLAGKLLARSDLDDAGRISQLHVTLYGRPATPQELLRGRSALIRLASGSLDLDPAKRRTQAWAWYAHALISANEFIYLR